MGGKSRSIAMIKRVLQTPIKLQRIKSLVIDYSTKGLNQTSVRHFLKSEVPILRFHNQYLKINVNRRESSEPAEVKCYISCEDDSKAPDFTLNGKDFRTASDIFQQILMFDQSKICNPLNQHFTVTLAANPPENSTSKTSSISPSNSDDDFENENKPQVKSAVASAT